MIRLILISIVAFEIFTFTNRGGGPLLSHLALTFLTFGVVSGVFLGGLKFKMKNKKAAIAYLCFFLLLVASTFTSKVSSFGLNELLLFGNAGILFFILSNLEIRQKEARLFAALIVGAFFVDALIGYFIYINNPFPRFAGTFLDVTRPFTAYGNDFADIMLLVIPLAVWLLLRPNVGLRRLFIGLISACVLLSALLLGFSRGAWSAGVVAVVLTLIWILVWKYRASRLDGVIERATILIGGGQFVEKKWIFVRIATVAVVGVLLVNALQISRARNFKITSFFDKATFNADEGSASVSYRWEYWKGAAKLIKDEPILGHGFWSFRYAFPKYQEIFGIAENHPHNIFLKIGVENGLPAAIFFGLFLVLIAWQLLPKLWRQHHPAALFFLIGPLAAFGHNLLDYNFVSSNFTLFIVLLAVGASLIDPPEFSQSTPNHVVLCIIFSSLLLAVGLYEGYYNADFKTGRALVADGKILQGIERLESSGNLIFERDRSVYLAQAYNLQFESTHDLIWREKEKQLLLSQVGFTIDSRIATRLGEILREEKKYDMAESFFKRALELDGENELLYYWNEIDALRTLKKEDSENYKKIVLDAKTILEEYKQTLAENRQLTILTENPEFAAKLFRSFKMEEDALEIESIWFGELLKFAEKYGADALRVGTAS